ncbi:MAG TPA: TonB-dependent receptor [Longimicrobium sp.]|nr:TonB-dependent receptor [Longimicrobium sp.]
MPPRPVRTLLYLLALVLAAAHPALAQQTGTIAGSVRDVGSGTSVVGAQVEAVGATGLTAGTATTDMSGRYRITGVAPGRYAVVVSGSGFETRRVEAEVSGGGTATVNFQINTGNVQLDPLVISASKRPEKAIEAPARVEVVGEREIAARPAVTPTDHLRSIPGVDIASTGVQSTNVVARGFNNIFSGSLLTLTDYRMANIPSLRVNFLHFVPANNDDIQRMEVVLGPGAALYGPNTANGILHILTKSPLDEQGTTVVLGGGDRSTFQGEFRTAHLLGENLGFKLSGQYLRSEEWRYDDPAEASEVARFRCAFEAAPSASCSTAQIAASRFARNDLARAVGIDTVEANARVRRIGQRDFDVQRWAGDARVDWRISPSATAVLSGGMSTSSNGIELTGLGASQIKDWSYRYLQARTSINRFFAQAYYTGSNAGETFLLRNGAPITDRSSVMVAQVQHGTDFWGGRQRFTYGADFTFTNPVTDGSINGLYEDDDETTEYGGYLQSETAISPKLDLVLAGRLDNHSALADPVFSPRAAVVFKPLDGHAFRVSYNRAFSTPGSLQQFLDLGSSLPNQQLAQLGYSLRVQGTGSEGFSLEQPGGGYLVRSPFTPVPLGGPGQLLPASSSALYPLLLGVLQAGGLPGPVVGYLNSLAGPLTSNVGLSYLDVVAGGAPRPLSELALGDIPPIRESISTTLEAGYKGILANRVLLAADVWWSRKDDLVTPLTIQTPLVLFNGQQLGAFLVPRLMADLGFSQAQALALVTQMASVPVGVVSSEDIHANGAQLLVTYVNVDETLDLWGTDVSAKVLIGNEWSVGLSGSFVSEDHWRTQSAGLVTLNAPTRKGTLTINYDDAEDTGLTSELRVRHTNGFPVNSGVYVGTLCLLQEGQTPGALEEGCVDDYTLLDMNLGYRLPFGRRNTTLQVSVTNLLDEDYRPFPGVPTIGRMLLARVKYEF